MGRSESDMRELGLLGLLAQCSPHVTQELRECIEMAFNDNPLVDRLEHRINRVDFVTSSGTSSFETAPPDKFFAAAASYIDRTKASQAQREARPKPPEKE